MARAVRRSPSQVKDALLEHISQDIKGLQSLQCDISTHLDAITSNNSRAQTLCEHFDCLFLHGLYTIDNGYWPCVSYFTYKDAIKTINELINVRSNLGKGRAWLNLTLNEQVMESYLRMFIENQPVLEDYYIPEAFLRDVDRLSILQTLVSGLDFVTFDLSMDEKYLDFSATPSDLHQSSLNFDISPSFIASVTPEMKRKETFTHSSDAILSSSSLLIGRRELPQQPAPIFSSLPSTITTINVADDPPDSGIYISDADSTSSHTHQINLSPSETVTLQQDSYVHEMDRAGLVQGNEDQTESGTSGQPSFYDRFLQLDEQEKEQIKEEQEAFLVARQRKSKGKKRKKRKDTQMERDDNDYGGSLTTPTHSWQDSIKENQPPSIPSVMKHSQPPVDLYPINTISDKWVDTDTTPTHYYNIEEEEGSVTNPFENSPKVVNLLDEIKNSPTELTHSIQDLHNEVINTEDNYLTSHDSHVTDNPKDVQTFEFLQEDDEIMDINSRLHSGAISLTEKTPDDYHLLDSKRPTYLDTTPNTGKSSKSYDTPPIRPANITDVDKRASDVLVDANTKLILSLDVFFQPEETICRLVQIQVPTGPGRYKTSYIAITDAAVYLLQRDGTEGVYSRTMSISYNQLEHIVIGLSWQSLGLVYKKGAGSQYLEKQMIITGSEAVSKSIANSIRTTAAQSKKFGKSIPLNRDDESRVEAIERELIKLGSETSMEVVRYCLVHWEQLSGEMPLFSPPADIGVPFSGSLDVKEMSLLKKPYWRKGYFSLIEGTLFYFNSEDEKSPRATYPLRGPRCGGCTRANGESKQFAFTVWDNNGSSLVLAANNEEEMAKWMQALCLAVIGDKATPSLSPIHKGGAFCAVLLTQNKIHVLQEDWSNESVQLITSISVQDINDIGVDEDLPMYCTLSYDDWENNSEGGMWMLCFCSEYELGQFEKMLITRYKDIFQVDPQFSEMLDPAVKNRAQHAIELTQASRHRSDSVTKGRTEFTYEI